MAAPFATRLMAPERLLEVTPEQFSVLLDWMRQFDNGVERDADGEDVAKRAWLREIGKDPRDFEHRRTAIVVAWIRL